MLARDIADDDDFAELQNTGLHAHADDALENSHLYEIHCRSR